MEVAATADVGSTTSTETVDLHLHWARAMIEVIRISHDVVEDSGMIPIDMIFSPEVFQEDGDQNVSRKVQKQLLMQKYQLMNTYETNSELFKFGITMDFVDCLKQLLQLKLFFRHFNSKLHRLNVDEEAQFQKMAYQNILLRRRLIECYCIDVRQHAFRLALLLCCYIIGYPEHPAKIMRHVAARLRQALQLVDEDRWKGSEAILTWMLALGGMCAKEGSGEQMAFAEEVEERNLSGLLGDGYGHLDLSRGEDLREFCQDFFYSPEMLGSKLDTFTAGIRQVRSETCRLLREGPALPVGKTSCGAVQVEMLQ